MASYQETGRKINDRIKPILNKLDPHDKEQLINAVLWMGQTAKYRCRHNTAYDSFCSIIFKDVAKVRRMPLTISSFNGVEKTFPVLMVQDTLDIITLAED